MFLEKVGVLLGDNFENDINIIVPLKLSSCYFHVGIYLDSISFCRSMNLPITISSDFSSLVTGFFLFEGGFDSSFFLLIPALLEAKLGRDLLLVGLDNDVSPSS